MKQARRNVLELARHLMVSVLAGLIALGPAGLAFANPTGQKVVKGNANFSTEGNTFVINTQNGTIIKYKGFDIANGETVRFQPLEGAKGVIRVLNRIDSKAPT